MLKSIPISFCFLFLIHFNSFAQTDSNNVDVLKLSIIGGVTTGAFLYGHAFTQNIWWKGEKSDFHFEWNYDWNYALGADKLGHVFFPYLVTNLYSDLFQWSGINKNKSFLYAGILAFSYQTFIEIKDGFSKQWGFSWGDFTANTLGSVYPILQNEYPSLKKYNLKVSFLKSERFRNGSHTTIIDDYESTYHWLTISFRDFFNDEIKSSIPKWLNIAIGHGVEQLDNSKGGNHQLFISLDWNLAGIETNNEIISFILKYLNFYRLPAPAIKIYPKIITYGLRF